MQPSAGSDVYGFNFAGSVGGPLCREITNGILREVFKIENFVARYKIILRCTLQFCLFAPFDALPSFASDESELSLSSDCFTAFSALSNSLSMAFSVFCSIRSSTFSTVFSFTFFHLFQPALGVGL